jgi:hypothetical protein
MACCTGLALTGLGLLTSASAGQPAQGWFRASDEPLRVLGGEVEDLHVIDIDGDGDGDLLFNLDVRSSLARVGLIRNLSPAGLATETTAMSGSGLLLIADVDSQSGPDLVLLGTDSSGLVSINDGNGNFTLTTGLFPGLPSPPYVAGTALDVDGDGDLDVAAVDRFSVLRIYFNRGGLQGGATGNFDAGQTLPLDSGLSFGLPTGSLLVADLNADGADDLVALLHQTPEEVTRISSLMNQSGQFAVTYSVVDNAAFAIDLGRANDDPFPDLLVGRAERASRPTSVQLGLGNGSFLPSTFGFPPMLKSGPVALAELFGGSPDEVVISGWIANPPNILAGESSLSVWTEGPLFERFRHVGQCPLQRVYMFDAMALGDLDADGDLDVTHIERSYAALPNGRLASAIGFQINGVNDGHNACCASEQSARVMLPIAPVTPRPEHAPPAPRGAASTPEFVDLNLLHRLREEVMRPRDEGNRLAELYDALAPDAFVALTDYTLLLQLNSVLRAWQPNIQALVDGEGDTALLTAAQILEADAALIALSNRGQPALTQAIAVERARLPPFNQFIGMSMSQFADGVLGPSPQLFADRFESGP